MTVKAFPELAEVPKFFKLVEDNFSFLIDAYGYHLHDTSLSDVEDIREATANVIYLNKSVGIKIYWYFSPGLIDVDFVELADQNTYPDHVKYYETEFWRNKINVLQGVSLSTVMSMLGYSNELILKDYSNLMPSKCRKRAKIIQENMQGVLEGLAKSTQTHTSSILNGDSSRFSEIIHYRTINMTFP